ncbi:MAG: aminotransferase class III-fold pyridoxal phosphate-dependent enzyme [Acidimicrobiales bacterium]|nr:aminotransferase class III-fold pyridoxal phosphate-dependent enzyme [Acidimicrobiales bacterium]
MDTSRFPLIPGTQPILITSSEGVWLEAADGRRILDAGGGAVVTNIGHGRPEIAEIAANALTQLDYVVPLFATESRVSLVDEVADHWLPDPSWRCVFVSGGSESIDAAMRIAQLHHVACGRPERHKVIGRDVSYHGATIGALAVGSHDRRRKGLELALPTMPKTSHHDPEQLEKIIEIEGAHTISAFVGEPVIGAAAGAYVPPDNYWPTVSEICARHDILVIADEVMTGFGRLGTKMGHEALGFTPDIIAAGKGLGGGYVPMGGVYTRADVVEPIGKTNLALMFYTFAGHDLSCSVARKVLEILREENLVARAETMGIVLRDRLETEFGEHPNVEEVRGRGLLHGLGLVADRDTGAPFPRSAAFADKVASIALDNGVWVYPSGSGIFDDAIMFGPPFIVTEDDIDQMVTVARRAIDVAAAELT